MTPGSGGAADAAARWLDAWTRGWREHDPGVIATVYAEDALFLSHPFREPLRGAVGAAAYARRAFAGEDEVELWFAEPRLADAGAAVEYWAIVRSGETTSTLAGVSLLRFGADGRVVEHRDYWAAAEGARRPPDGWGPAAAHGRRP